MSTIAAFAKSYVFSLAAPAHFVCVLWWWLSRARLKEFLPQVRQGSRVDEGRGLSIVGDMELASSACAMVGVAATLFAVHLQSEKVSIPVPYVGTIFGVCLAIVLGAGERRWRRRITDAIGATQLDDLVSGLAASTNVLAETLSAMHGANTQLEATRSTFALATEHLRTSAQALAETLPNTILQLQSAVGQLPALIAEQRIEAANAEREAAAKLLEAANALSFSSSAAAQATDHMETCATKLADVGEQVHHVFRNLPHEITTQLQRSTQPLGEVRQILEGVASTMQAASQKLSGASAAVIEGASKTQHGVGELTRQVTELGQAVSSLKGAGNSFEAAAGATLTSVSDLAEQLDKLKSSIDDFEKSITKHLSDELKRRPAMYPSPSRPEEVLPAQRGAVQRVGDGISLEIVPAPFHSGPPETRQPRSVRPRVPGPPSSRVDDTMTVRPPLQAPGTQSPFAWLSRMFGR